jgi:hypothetical protein
MALQEAAAAGACRTGRKSPASLESFSPTDQCNLLDNHPPKDSRLYNSSGHVT